MFEYLEKSFKIAKEIGSNDILCATYTNLGLAYDGLGNFGKAIEYTEKSLEIAKEIGDTNGETTCYLNLGMFYRHSGNISKGIEYHEKSLEITKRVGEKYGELLCYTHIGNAYDSSGEFNKAVENHKKSLKIAKEIGDIDSVRNISYNLGKIYERNNNLELAYGYYKRTIELSQIIGRRLIEEPNKISFYISTSKIFHDIIPLCLKLKKDSEAFEYTERSKSRAFLDLLATTEIRPTVKLTDKLESLLGDEENCLDRLRKLQTRHLTKSSTPVEPREVDNIINKLNEIYDKMEVFDQQYASIRQGKPQTLKEIQKILSQKAKTILVEYYTIKDKIFIFVLSSEELKVRIVQLSDKQLNRYIRNYQREMIEYRGDIGDTWQELNRYLIEPISDYLSKSDLIYFVPYGLLHYIPIHALKLNGEPIIKKHAVAYLPSASLLKFCKNKGSGVLNSCASFGIVFKEEAENVAELFKTQAHIEMKKEEVLKNLDKDILHFSCHGYFNYIDPLLSGIKLQDDILTAKEVFKLKLSSELVTLSACQTGLNERKPGDELIGLTRAFLYAGAPSLIVSLWSVNADSTKEMMLEFYKLLKKGRDKATALQEAQKEVMEKDEYAHPYFWAPFILVGDWE